jgi:hypothetical protein
MLFLFKDNGFEILKFAVSILKLGAGDRVRTCIFQLGRLNVFHKPHALTLALSTGINPASPP